MTVFIGVVSNSVIHRQVGLIADMVYN